jgi:hypothetical protein
LRIDRSPPVFIPSSVELTAMPGPTSRQRVGFWLLLGLTSAAFAEVPFPTTAFETAGLVLFWHPVVAFLLPVTVVETIATSSGRSLGPPLSGHRFAGPLVVALAGYLLLFQAVLGGPGVAWQSARGCGVADGASRLAAGQRAHPQYASAATDRPPLGVLVVVSLALGALIRPDALPTQRHTC